MNLLRILIWTYGSGEVELMEEGITSSGGMVGDGSRGKVDLWCGSGGRGRWCAGQVPRGDVGAAAAAGGGRGVHRWRWA